MTPMSRRTFLIAVIILFAGNCGSSACAQANGNLLASNLPMDSSLGAIYADTPIDTAMKTQNPTVALFKSLFVPGWGQIGNKKYFKAAIIIPVEVTLIGAIVHYAGKTSDAEAAFKAETDLTRKAVLFADFQDAKDQRNRFSWYTGTLIFLSMFDAYVDAHLAQFPSPGKKLSFDIKNGNGDYCRIVLSYKF